MFHISCTFPHIKGLPFIFAVHAEIIHCILFPFLPSILAMALVHAFLDGEHLHDRNVPFLTEILSNLSGVWCQSRSVIFQGFVIIM